MQNYSKSQNLDILLNLFSFFNEHNIITVSDLNKTIILFFKNLLNINTQIVYSSQLNITGEKDIFLSNILKKLDASNYIYTPCFEQYMKNYGFSKYPCKVEKFNYKNAIQNFALFRELWIRKHSRL